MQFAIQWTECLLLMTGQQTQLCCLHCGRLKVRYGAAAEEGAWQDIPLGLDPRVLDLLGNSIALNTTASVRQEEGQFTS